MAARTFTDEELNYFRLCYVVTRIVPDGLRTVFKQLWDTSYKATHGEWLDTAKNAIDFYSMESTRSRNHNRRLLTVMANGNTSEWDCTCLFYAILYSDSLGPVINTAVKNSVDELRKIRNEAFAHTTDGKLTEVDFQAIIKKILIAFTTLKLDSAAVDEVKNQTSFQTEELSNIQQQLESEKKRNAESKSFCDLPPKPSHDTTDRLDEVTKICKEMEKLRITKKNETTVIYLSGNPGCGKSELARQIGDKYFNAISDETTEPKFVVTLDASSIDTLLQSYIEFAGRLRCDDDFVLKIATSKDLSQEEKIKNIRSLIDRRVQNYPSWLIIVDNVTDLKSVSKYLPQAGEKANGKGQILVTTQDSKSIPCDSYTYHLLLSSGMKHEDAIALLSQVSGLTSVKEITLKVAKALDFQPLALACAAVYMQRICKTGQSKPNWEKYLLKLQDGKREATETTYKKTSLTYPTTMTVAVRLALEREVSEDKIMMHAFQFLSIIANEPIPLEYVVQYVMKCMPDKDQDLVASYVCSSSLVISSEEESKEIRVHQVVYGCLVEDVLRYEKEEEVDILDLMLAFSALDPFELDQTRNFIATRPLVPHFVIISTKLKHFAKHHPNVLENSIHTTYCISTIGHICCIHGSYKATEIYFQICLSIQQCVYDEKNSALADTLNGLGNCLCELGQYERAKTYLERALAIDENVYDSNHPSFSITLNNLGSCLSELGQHENAKTCLERALAINEKVYDSNHPRLAIMLNNLGDCLRELGQYENAKTCLERALAIEEKVYDSNNPSLAITLNNLGNCLNELGQYENAKTCLERALAINENVYDSNHPKLAMSLNNLGVCFSFLGQYENAKTYSERALAIDEIFYHSNHPRLAMSLSSLGCCLCDLGQYENAKTCLERALAIDENAYDSNNPKLAITLRNLGNCLRELGQYENAKTYSERALAIDENFYHSNHPRLASGLSDLGCCLCDLGQYENAKTCLERALAIDEKVYDSNHPDLAMKLNNLGNCLSRLGQYENARTYLERAVAIGKNVYDSNHPTLILLLKSLSDVSITRHNDVTNRPIWSKARKVFLFFKKRDGSTS